jgi:hypothetical protein
MRLPTHPSLPHVLGKSGSYLPIAEGNQSFLIAFAVNEHRCAFEVHHFNTQI